MRSFLAAVLAGGLLCLMASGGSAKPNSEADATTAKPSRTEVIVFEISGCKYCVVFRENLGARYLSSTTNTLAPMRFVDVGRLDPEAFHLSGDIGTVPTIVLMRDGREVDRIEGYPLSEILFGMVKSRVGSDSD